MGSAYYPLPPENEETAEPFIPEFRSWPRLISPAIVPHRRAAKLRTDSQPPSSSASRRRGGELTRVASLYGPQIVSNDPSPAPKKDLFRLRSGLATLSITPAEENRQPTLNEWAKRFRARASSEAAIVQRCSLSPLISSAAPSQYKPALKPPHLETVCDAGWDGQPVYFTFSPGASFKGNQPAPRANSILFSPSPTTTERAGSALTQSSIESLQSLQGPDKSPHHWPTAKTSLSTYFRPLRKNHHRPNHDFPCTTCIENRLAVQTFLLRPCFPHAFVFCSPLGTPQEPRAPPPGLPPGPLFPPLDESASRGGAKGSSARRLLCRRLATLATAVDTFFRGDKLQPRSTVLTSTTAHTNTSTSYTEPAGPRYHPTRAAQEPPLAPSSPGPESQSGRLTSIRASRRTNEHHATHPSPCRQTERRPINYGPEQSLRPNGGVPFHVLWYDQPPNDSVVLSPARPLSQRCRRVAHPSLRSDIFFRPPPPLQYLGGRALCHSTPDRVTTFPPAIKLGAVRQSRRSLQRRIT